MKINNEIKNKNIQFQGKYNTVKVQEKIPEIIGSIIEKSSKDYKVLEQNLENLCEKIATNTYRLKNYILIPSDINLSEIIDQNALFYMNKKDGILEYFKKIEISPDNILHVFRARNSDENIVKFSAKNVSDSAKQDFYMNLKELIMTGRVDKSEVLNDSAWYMAKDGSQIYTLSPNLNGCTTYSEREKIAETLFNKLFNTKP